MMSVTDKHLLFNLATLFETRCALSLAINKYEERIMNTDILLRYKHLLILAKSIVITM